MALNPDEVLEALQAGASNPEAARQFKVRPATIAAYRRRLVKSGDLEPQFSTSKGGSSDANGAMPPALADAMARGGVGDLEADNHVEDDLADLVDPQDPAIDQARQSVAVKLLKVRELRADVELAELEKRLVAAGPVIEPISPGADPMMQMMMAQMADARAQSTALMTHLLRLSTAPPPPPPPPPAAFDMKAMISAFELFQTFQGEAQPQDTIGQLMSLAGKALEHRNSAVAAQASPPGVVPVLTPPTEDQQGGPTTTSPGQSTPTSAPPPAFDPEAEMRDRVSLFFDHVEREMSTGADPRSIAEQVYQPVGMLPADLREALCTETPLSTVMPIVAKYLPPERVETLTQRVATNQQDAQFLGLLLGQLRKIEIEETGGVLTNGTE